MLCDLHIHSGYSSGTQPLDEIADEARAKGIGMISITDDAAFHRILAHNREQMEEPTNVTVLESDDR